MYSAGQTVPSTAQIIAEGNNTKCVGKKRFNGSVIHGLRKEHALRSPIFGQGWLSVIHYCCYNHYQSMQSTVLNFMLIVLP